MRLWGQFCFFLLFWAHRGGVGMAQGQKNRSCWQEELAARVLSRPSPAHLSGAWVLKTLREMVLRLWRAWVRARAPACAWVRLCGVRCMGVRSCICVNVRLHACIHVYVCVCVRERMCGCFGLRAALWQPISHDPCETEELEW